MHQKKSEGRYIMKKRLFALTVFFNVIFVCYGCGNTDEETTKNVETNTSINIETTTAGNTTAEVETTSEVETTEVIETTTSEGGSEEETTREDGFDPNAERYEVPTDALYEGYDFSDSVFVGDSRTEGLYVYNVLRTSTILATRGLMASSVLTEEFIEIAPNIKITVLDYLKTHSFKKIYIMFGINEVGCEMDTFVRSYKEFIREIRIVQPDIEIYAESIIPMVEDRTNEIYNNEVIAQFDAALRELCVEENVKYVNVAAAVIDENGGLRDDLSRDGIHLNVPGMTAMVNYLILATCK